MGLLKTGKAERVAKWRRGKEANCAVIVISLSICSAATMPVHKRTLLFEQRVFAISKDFYLALETRNREQNHREFDI